MNVQKGMHLVTVFALLCFTNVVFSQQLKLGKNPFTIEKSAVLELQSDNQGLLFPRISDTSLVNALNPSDGLVVYYTPLKKLMVRANHQWVPLTSGTIDTTNISDFYTKVRSLFTATAPLAVYNGKITMSKATSSENGYLSSADWITFNNKLSAVDTGNIAAFSAKVRSLFSAGNGISYNAATGVITATATGGGGSSGSTSGWSLSGNSSVSNNFLGTTDGSPLIFKVNNQQTARFEANNLALGTSATVAGGSNSLALGSGSYITVSNAIGLGNSAKVQGGSDGIAIGNSTYVSSLNAMAIGPFAQAQGNAAIVVGQNAYGSGTNSIVIGANNAKAQNTSAISIGPSTYTSGVAAIAMGENAQSQGTSAVVIGKNAYASGSNSISIGGTESGSTKAQGANSISMGNMAVVYNSNAIAIGNNTVANSTGNIAIGNSAYTNGGSSIAIGDVAKANNQNSIAVGQGATTNNSSAVAIGEGATASSNASMAIGNGASVGYSGTDAIAVGTGANAGNAGSGSIAIGKNSTVTNNAGNAVAIGANATANQSNTIILGDVSNTALEVGIGTSSPSAKLDVNGTVKLGTSGSVIKNLIAFEYDSYSSISIPGSGNTGNSLEVGKYDLIISIPSSNALASTKGTVNVSFNNDLPEGVFVAYARAISTTQIKIRFINCNSSNASISSNVNMYISIVNF